MRHPALAISEALDLEAAVPEAPGDPAVLLVVVSEHELALRL